MAALLAGCGTADSASDVSSGESTGTTDQGFRALVLDAPDGEVSLRLKAECEPPATTGYTSPYGIPLEGHELTASLREDGRFVIEESYIEEWTDGDEAHVVVEVDGKVEVDGTANGVLRAGLRVWNGQNAAFDMECVTGDVDWSAVPADMSRLGRDVAVPGVIGVEPAGTGVVAFIADGRPVVIGPDGAGEPVGEPFSDAEEMGFADYVGALAVVDGAVWSHGRPDPQGAGIVRTDLATGAQVSVAKHVLAFAYDSGELFALTLVEEQVRLERMDPVTGATLASVPAEGGRLAVDDARLWVVPQVGPGVFGYDRETLDLTSEHPIGEPALDVVIGPGGLWLLREDTISFLDTTSGVESVMNIGGVGSLVADERGAWVSQPQERVLRRVEGGEIVDVVDLPEGASDLEPTNDGSLWASLKDRVLEVRP